MKNRMSKKNIAIFSGALLLEGIAFSWMATQTASYDDLMILLFPGVLGMAFDGVNVTSVLIFMGITALTYIIGGLVLALVYAGIQKIIPSKIAFLITLVIPIFILTGIMYSQHKKNQQYIQQNIQQSSVGETPVSVHE